VDEELAVLKEKGMAKIQQQKRMQLDKRMRSRLRVADKQITVIRPTTLAITLDKTMGEGYPLVESFTINGCESCLC
jgi:hypothetical protein